MRPSVTMLLIAVLVGIWAAWMLWSSFRNGHWTDGVVGLAMLITATGLLLLRTWAKYLVYALTVVFSVSWAYWVWQAVGDDWPYADPLATVISLLPGVFLLCTCIGASYVVYRQYTKLDRTSHSEDVKERPPSPRQ